MDRSAPTPSWSIQSKCLAWEAAGNFFLGATAETAFCIHRLQNQLCVVIIPWII